MSEVRLRLKDAIETGEILGIVYFGGSQPGTYREIYPIKLEGKHFKAKCFTSDAVKIFTISRVEILSNDASRPTEWSLQHVDTDRFEHFDTIYSTYGDYFVSLGWHVEVSSSNELTITGISLHRYFKNGKVRKAHDISMEYCEQRIKYCITENNDEIIEEYFKSTKPWTLRSKYLSNTRTYKKADSAVRALVEIAETHAPYEVSNLSRPALPKTIHAALPKISLDAGEDKETRQPSSSLPWKHKGGIWRWLSTRVLRN